MSDTGVTFKEKHSFSSFKSSAYGELICSHVQLPYVLKEFCSTLVKYTVNSRYLKVEVYLEPLISQGIFALKYH